MDGWSGPVAGRTSAVPSPSKGTTPRPDAAASLTRFRLYLESAKFGLDNVRPQDTLRFETSFTNAREILGFKLSLWVADWKTNRASIRQKADNLPLNYSPERSFRRKQTTCKPSRGAAGLAARAAHPKLIDTRDISDRSRPPLGFRRFRRSCRTPDRQSKGV